MFFDMYCTSICSHFCFTLCASNFIFVTISLLKIVSLLHVSLSINVPVHIYVCVNCYLYGIGVPNTGVQCMIITTALRCECLTELLDHG